MGLLALQRRVSWPSVRLPVSLFSGFSCCSLGTRWHTLRLSIPRARSLPQYRLSHSVPVAFVSDCTDCLFFPPAALSKFSRAFLPWVWCGCSDFSRGVSAFPPAAQFHFFTVRVGFCHFHGLFIANCLSLSAASFHPCRVCISSSSSWRRCCHRLSGR